MKLKVLITFVLGTTLTACGGGSGSEPPAQKKKVKLVVPQMSITPVLGSVADPKDGINNKSYDQSSMYSVNTNNRTSIEQCVKSLNLFNIYSFGWSEEFNEGLSAKQEKELKGLYGIHGANGIVDYSDFIDKNQMFEAKDWVSYFYYDSLHEDCEARRDRPYATVNKVGENITELSYQYSFEATKNSPQQTWKNYTAWQNDPEANELIGLVTNVVTGDVQLKKQLKSYTTDSERITDSVNVSDSFRHSYALESYANNQVEYQIVGGKVIGQYVTSSSEPVTYYAVSLISAHFTDVGTKVLWCTRGSEYSTKNKENPISKDIYEDVIETGDFEMVYCDPFDNKINQVRYYDTQGNKVEDSSKVATDLDNKLVQGTVVHDRIKKLATNKDIYSGKNYVEYLQEYPLAEQVDQIKVDLTL